MRNSTAIALGIALFATLPMEAEMSSPLRVLDHIKAVKTTGVCQNAPEKSRQASEARRQISEAASKLKPSITKTYGWSGKKWVLDENITYTYDASGNPLTESSTDSEGFIVNTVYEYDSNGKVTYKESKVSSDGVNFENYKKTEFKYDPILTNVITKRTEWLWMGDDWQLIGNNYERRFTRNDEGNVTSVVIAVLFNGEYDPTQRVDIAYGEDGKASSISEQILGYDGRDYYWEQGILITDIKWENTDGQIYDPEDLFLGNNRIKTAHYEDTDDMSFDVSAEYAADSNAYKVDMVGVMSDDEMGDFEIKGMAEFTPLENDGYILEGSSYFMGFPMNRSKEEVRYDDWGHLTLQYYEETEDDDLYYEKTIGEVEFDAEWRPSSYTVSEEYIGVSGEPVLEKAFRAEYFDYLDVTAGAGHMEVDSEAPVRYYNLQGIQVTNPEKGTIVIKQQGDKRLKIKC